MFHKKKESHTDLEHHWVDFLLFSLYRSLGCILYEMCCLVHAFEGQNFLAVVLKIVEGPTPSLPETYSRQLNSLMQRYQKQMLPCSRHESGPCHPTPPSYICPSARFGWVDRHKSMACLIQQFSKADYAKSKQV